MLVLKNINFKSFHSSCDEIITKKALNLGYDVAQNLKKSIFVA